MSLEFPAEDHTMPLRSRSKLLLFFALGALVTAAAAQSTQESTNQLPPAPLFATPHVNGNVAAPEPQFQFHLPARILRPQIRIPQRPLLLAEQKCFSLRSYHFAPNQGAAEAPQLQSYSTCTPATGRELHPTSEPPSPNR
ncbi:MAG TPA: hypothetical protein VFA99_02360 [Acidobacteriaceae bacterium]|nr:hypothetical protein [Acidobacteriaceae bacterium]